jgi:L-2-hydroxyglutarate oxidase LhgO
MVEADVVIVGAGWHGLAFAKTYLEIHPSLNLLLLDSVSS